MKLFYRVNDGPWVSLDCRTVGGAKRVATRSRFKVNGLLYFNREPETIFLGFLASFDKILPFQKKTEYNGQWEDFNGNPER